MLLTFTTTYVSLIISSCIAKPATISTSTTKPIYPFKNFFNTLFEFNPGPDRTSESAYDKWENDLFDFNPNPHPEFFGVFNTQSQSPRKLNPVDLSKPFVFDDEDEVRAAEDGHYNDTGSEIPMKDVEFLEEEKSTPRSSTPTDFMLPEKNYPEGGIWSFSHGHGFYPDPLQQGSKIIKKRFAKGQGQLIFPDDPEYTGLGLRPPRTTTLTLECKEEETLYNSKCEPLFSQGSCPAGEHLVEDETTGEGKCTSTPECPFPDKVILAGSGECVMVRFHICPQGMRLTTLRSGLAECDCRPGFLYSAKDKICYEAYKKGPCKRSEYFILPKTENSESEPQEPKCVRNPCNRSGQGFVCYGPNCLNVQRRSEDCVELGSLCDTTSNIKGVLVVNPGTLELECRSREMNSGSVIEIETRILSNIPTLGCAPGTKKDITGNCRKTFKFNRSTKRQ